MKEKEFLKKSFHTHTYRCGHAIGKDEEYVLAAIKMGINELGFSDHIFYPKEDEYECNSRMMLLDALEYTNSINDLKKKYKSIIDIYIGFEMDYIPFYYERQINELKQLQIDYLILGQHHVGDELNGIYVGKETSDENVLKRYVNLIVGGLEKNIFSYVAHPDMCYFVGDKKVFETEIDRICEAAKNANVPLEMNLHGMELKRHYPNIFFWQIVKEHGNPVIFGIDAHSPDSILNKEGYEECVRLTERLGLDVIDVVDCTKWRKFIESK